LSQKLSTLFKEIIKIDEKLLNENQSLKIELGEKISNYEQFAKERNKTVSETN
jgi:hypothetical protein